jgi:hypothetical protein
VSSKNDEVSNFEGITEVFEFTTAEAASIGTKDGRTVLLAIRQGVDEHGQPCALYITGKKAESKGFFDVND